MDYQWIKSYFVYVILIGISLFVVQTIVVAKTEQKHQIRVTSVLAVIIYLAALFYVTLGFRQPSLEHKYNLVLFWSYEEILFQKNRFLLWENMANILAFLPLGMFLQEFAGSKMKCYYAALAGMALSILIEAAQLVFRLGLCELDDVVHNTLGTVLGYAAARLIQKIVKKYYDRGKKRR